MERGRDLPGFFSHHHHHRYRVGRSSAAASPACGRSRAALAALGVSLAKGTIIGPLDGGALTHWGARAPTRGPAAAPVRSRVLGASHRSACGDQGTVVQIARRWRAHPWGMRAPARGPTTTPSPLFALALSLDRCCAERGKGGSRMSLGFRDERRTPVLIRRGAHSTVDPR